MASVDGLQLPLARGLFLADVNNGLPNIIVFSVRVSGHSNKRCCGAELSFNGR